jgi:hypothetical protein
MEFVIAGATIGMAIIIIRVVIKKVFDGNP